MSWMPTTSTSSGGLGNLAGTISGWFGPVSGIVGGLFGGIGGPTGNAQVHFYNERNAGPQWWYGKDVGAVYNTFEEMYMQLGTSLQSFGWQQNEVPREATAIFKNAENYFFNNIDNYLTKVANGDAIRIERLFGDSDVQQRYEQIQNNMVSNTNTTSGNTASNSNPLGLLNMKVMGIPAWLLVVAFFILRKK